MRYLVACLVVVVSLLAYRVISMLDAFKTYELKNQTLCERHSLPFPAEDFVEFDRVLIGGVSDKVSLYIDKTKGPAVTSDGWLIAVDPDTYNYRNLTIINWPQDIAFHPLGLSIYNTSTLLVVNLAYNRGGQRLEVLSLRMEGSGDVVVAYEKSILFNEQFQGIVNSVAKISPSEIYVTTWHPFPDEATGRAHDIWSSVTRMFYWTFFKATYLWKCSDDNGNAVCTKAWSGRVLNGLAYQNNQLYVADTGDKQVLVFKVKQNRSIDLRDTIPLNFGPDNLAIGHDGHLYVSGCTKALESVKRLTGGTEQVASTVARLDKQAKGWGVTELYIQTVISGASVAVPLGSSFVLGSWHDPAYGVCRQIS